MAGKIGRVAVSRGIVDALSIAERDLLLLHIDRAVGVFRGHNSGIHATLKLMNLKLIRGDASGPTSLRPKFTVLTDSGRHAVAMLLADYADALVRAGCLDAESPTPSEILRQMKMSRSRKPAPSPDPLFPARIALSQLEK